MVFDFCDLAKCLRSLTMILYHKHQSISGKIPSKLKDFYYKCLCKSPCEAQKQVFNDYNNNFGVFFFPNHGAEAEQEDGARSSHRKRNKNPNP